MNGASGDVCAKIRINPKITINRISGSSQNFLRARMNRQSSAKMENLDTQRLYQTDHPTVTHGLFLVSGGCALPGTPLKAAG